jgi:hypothetical protein
VGWALAAGVIGLVAISGGLEAIARGLALPQHADAVANNALAMQIGGFRSTLFAAAALALIWAFSVRRVSPRTAVWALIALVAIDDWSVVRRYFQFSAPASQLYASDPIIEYLQKLPTPGRTIVAPLGGYAFGDPVLAGDALMIHGVRTVTSHQANEPQRWVDIAGAKSPALPPNALESRQFRRLANARFLLVNTEIPPVIPQLPDLKTQLRVGPVTDATGTTVYLYEILEANPPAWVVPVVAEAPADVIRDNILDPRLDLDAVALADSTTLLPRKRVSVAPSPLGIPVSVRAYGPGHIVLDLDRAAPPEATLIVSENWFPGWSAKVDGKAATLGRVDHTLIGVALPAGARHVELTFRDAAYHRAIPITAIALLMTVLVIVVGAAAGTRIRV